MAMILLSRILKPTANRWANIVAGIIETAAVLLTSFISSLSCHGNKFLLFVLWSVRSGLYFDDCLVRMEMAERNRPPN